MEDEGAIPDIPKIKKITDSFVEFLMYGGWLALLMIILEIILVFRALS